MFALAIDMPISQENATVEVLAIPSTEEFSDAQLQNPDLRKLRKLVKVLRFPTFEEIAGLGATTKEIPDILD